MSGVKWTQAEVETLRELREVKGWDFPSIAKAMGRTARSICGKAEREGIVLPFARQRGEPRNGQDGVREMLLRAFNDGVMIKAVAREHGVDVSRVRNAYKYFSQGVRKKCQRADFDGLYIGAKEMAAIVAPVCGVSPKAIFSGLRMRPAVLARMAVAKALRDRGLSLSVIGKAMGGRDHSTIHHLLEKFPEYAAHYPMLVAAYNAIKEAEQQAAERLAA